MDPIEAVQAVVDGAGRLREAFSKTMRGFAALGAGSSKAGALDPKFNKPIALGISIAARGDGCVAYHAKAARDRGASRAEVAETIGVAIHMGRPLDGCGARALRAMTRSQTSAAVEARNGSATDAAHDPAPPFIGLGLGGVDQLAGLGVTLPEVVQQPLRPARVPGQDDQADRQEQEALQERQHEPDYAQDQKGVAQELHQDRFNALPINSCHSASLNTVRPSSAAFLALDPASAPTTT
jgi:AhpD family alkylhydroperoxidase